MFTRRLLRRLALSALISFAFVSFFQQLLIDLLSQAIRPGHQQGEPAAVKHHVVQQVVNSTSTITTSTSTTGTSAKSRGFAILGEPHVRLEMVPDVADQARKNGRTRIIVSTSSEFTQSNLGGCPDWNCRIVNDHSQMDSADAIIFKMGGAHRSNNRNPSQYYVYFTQESPMHSGAPESYRGYYNLTMGYRRDADIPCPYGYTVERSAENEAMPMPDLTPEYLAAKNKPIAWFVSNCNTPSRRKQYVDALSQHIKVDIYGACGTMQCPKPAQRCNSKLSKEYRFYLAFENSICTDYITEKLWNQGYQADVVPIVLKDDIVNRFIPPGSYLAADQFPSVKALADRIQQLMSDDAAYLQMLSWKRHYDVIFLDGLVHDWRERPWGFCRLCDLLWQEPRPQRIKYDFSNWWKNETVCDHRLVDRLISRR